MFCLFVFFFFYAHQDLVFEASRFWSKNQQRLPGCYIGCSNKNSQKPCRSTSTVGEFRICHDFSLGPKRVYTQNFAFGRSGFRSPKGYRLYKGVAAVPFLFWYFTGWLSYRDPIHRPTEVFSWYSWEVRKPWLFRELFPNLFGIIRGHSCNTLVPKHCNRDTVDGRHPAPVDMANSWQLFRYLQGFLYIPGGAGFLPTVLWDFFRKRAPRSGRWNWQTLKSQIVSWSVKGRKLWEFVGRCWKSELVGWVLSWESTESWSWYSGCLQYDWILFCKTSWEYGIVLAELPQNDILVWTSQRFIKSWGILTGLMTQHADFEMQDTPHPQGKSLVKTQVFFRKKRNRQKNTTTENTCLGCFVRDDIMLSMKEV